MQDGIDYDVTIISRISSDTKVKTVQYFIVVNGAEIYNSGEITDRNPVANVTRNDIYVGQVFDNPNATAWELKFKNISLQY
jgi:hydroxymethylpyrimidine pyrophosphatase-like HAD family hydrolase